MNDQDRIKVGDKVHVDFNNTQTTLCHEAEVLWSPTNMGESWIFKDTTTGLVHYVSEGCTISKLR
jgi:hypothetical protein